MTTIGTLDIYGYYNCSAARHWVNGEGVDGCVLHDADVISLLVKGAPTRDMGAKAQDISLDVMWSRNPERTDSYEKDRCRNHRDDAKA